MGVDYNTYIGAYLVVKSKKITTHTKTIHCKNHPKRVFEEEGFCPECGDPLVILSIPKQDFADIYRLLDETEFEDDFYITEYMFGDNDNEMGLLISENQKCSVNADLEYCRFEEITNDMPQEFIENFKAIHKNALEFLKEKTESMEVEFGVVNYCN